MTMVDRIALGFVALVLLSMPVFAVVSRGRPVDAEVSRRPTTVLLGVWIRDWAMWILGPTERALVRWKVSPDVFNYLGAVFGLFAGVAFYFGELSVAGWMILLGGAMDIFDGRIARARNLANARGAFLDSTLDRFAETFTFAGVVMFFVNWPLALLASVLALGGSMLVSYARARGEALGVSCKEGLMQRAERLVLLALAALFDGAVTGAAGWSPGALLFGVVGVIAVGSLWTAAFRLHSIAADLQNERRM
jgi:CDP-diacylglycerol---glycerol-3-phosphate 3-phosphatidyltransferase